MEGPDTGNSDHGTADTDRERTPTRHRQLGPTRQIIAWLLCGEYQSNGLSKGSRWRGLLRGVGRILG